MFVIVIFKHACNSDIHIEQFSRRENNKRARTPSFLREVVQSVKKLQEFYYEDNDNSNSIPTALKDIIDFNSYEKNNLVSNVFMKEVRRK